jgi:hypothetical protein
MSCTEQELSTQDMLQGHIDLHHHLYGYHKSMALLCATDLGIPGAIHRRGGAATISDIVADTMIPPAKLPHLRRLMRVLSVSGIFAVEEDVYKLTPASRILVGDKASCNFSPLVHLVVSPAMLTTFSSLSPWFRDGRNASPTALFEMAHGMPPWEMMKRDDTMNSALNDACVADSSFLMEIALRERGDVVFRGLRSLVDVGGGHGGAAMAIAKAFPDIKCSVLDLPHVISQAPDDGTVCFIAGDMFEDIPPADAVLLKVYITLENLIYLSPYFSCHLKSHKKFEKNISLDPYVRCHFTNMQIQIQLIQVETKITNLTMNRTRNSQSNLLFF